MINELTKYEYHYLLGDEDFWDIKGAGLVAVSEFCTYYGWGDYGKPTERGKRAMEDYVKNLGLC